MPCKIVKPSCVCFVVCLVFCFCCVSCRLELSNCEDYGCCPSVLLLLILGDVSKPEE